MAPKSLLLSLGFLLIFGPGTDCFQMSDLTKIFRMSQTDGYNNLWDRESLDDSQVDMAINPGCPYLDCTLGNGTVPITIVNVTVVDDPHQDREYHWIWSVIGHPVIQAAITCPGNLMTINWSQLFGFRSVARSIVYQQDPVFSSAIMITKLIEFNDESDTATIPVSDDGNVIVYDIMDFEWKLVQVNHTYTMAAVQFLSENFSHPDLEIKGSINLTLSGYSTAGFGQWLPHLSHSERTNQFDIQLQGIETNSGFNSSRFAIELVIVSYNQDYVGYNFTRQKTTTLDDEHTPGIFTTEELIVPGLNESVQSYMQWRPIVYKTMARELSASTGVTVYNPKDIEEPSKVFNGTLLYALYGTDLEDIIVKAVNVSFGTPGDGFFQKTKYQAWTFTFGTGPPIRNGFSAMVILAIAVLMILTILPLGCAVTWYVFKKSKRIEEGYQVMGPNRRQAQR